MESWKIKSEEKRGLKPVISSRITSGLAKYSARKAALLKWPQNGHKSRGSLEASQQEKNFSEKTHGITVAEKTPGSGARWRQCRCMINRLQEEGQCCLPGCYTKFSANIFTEQVIEILQMHVSVKICKWLCGSWVQSFKFLGWKIVCYDLNKAQGVSEVIQTPKSSVRAACWYSAPGITQPHTASLLPVSGPLNDTRLMQTVKLSG